MKSRSSTATPRYEIESNFNFHLIHLTVICLHCLRDAFTMRCAILELEANLETFPVWFIFGGRLPQTRGIFSTVLLKSVAVCLYADGVRLVGIHPALEVAPQLSSGDKSAAWGAHQDPINQVRHSGQTNLIGRLGCDVICSYRSTEPYMDTCTRGTGICRLFTSFFSPLFPWNDETECLWGLSD